MTQFVHPSSRRCASVVQLALTTNFRIAIYTRRGRRVIHSAFMLCLGFRLTYPLKYDVGHKMAGIGLIFERYQDKISVKFATLNV